MIVSILTTLIVLGLIYWVLTLLPLPEPFPQIVRVVMIVVVVLFLLNLLTGRLGAFNLK